MAEKELFAAHVRERQRKAEAALDASEFDALVIHAGTPFTYHADDQDAPFHTTPHFAHWVPLTGPHHLLHVRPGKKPLLLAVRPEDFWYEQAPIGKPFWLDAFDVKEVADASAAWKLVEIEGRVAYVGDAPAQAQQRGIAPAQLNPAPLLAHLDWDRAYKTPWEVHCLEQAEKLAAAGHLAARKAFAAGASELGIHQAYVAAVGCTDDQLPYTSIVALDEKGATLHYDKKRTKKNGKVLLIDVGARHHGYASDITRTWTTDAADGQFRELVSGMDRLQQELCAMVRPGRPYLELHAAAHARIGDLLHTSGLIDRGGREAVDLGLTHPFFPHGLGHFLGLQVHDVGGRQKSPDGGSVPPPSEYPFLRTTRTVEPDQVFTIEPGVYFIEMLLRPQRSGPRSAHFDWKAIDRLMPCGGVRIEDDVLVTQDGHRNLTRAYLPE